MMSPVPRDCHESKRSCFVSSSHPTYLQWHLLQTTRRWVGQALGLKQKVFNYQQSHPTCDIIILMWEGVVKNTLHNWTEAWRKNVHLFYHGTYSFMPCNILKSRLSSLLSKKPLLSIKTKCLWSSFLWIICVKAILSWSSQFPLSPFSTQESSFRGLNPQQFLSKRWWIWKGIEVDHQNKINDFYFSSYLRGL